ncbi:DUF2971 domain-containing protein [Natrinema sp. HArc-T2]|uniref:DUF2971 domain-containing protein n=1 Tax=Natrinema sp. HArc-T2 TaxID=3242701 RepID=UPI00359E6764
MGDQFEASVPFETLRKEEEIAKVGGGFSRYGRKRVKKARKRNRKFAFLNCWHLNEYGESAAMWDLYSNNNVAIKTTFSKLRKSLQKSDEEIKFTKVKYLDFRPDGDQMPEEDRQKGWTHYVYKRKSFEHEKELRAIVWKPVRIEAQGSERDDGIKPDELTESMLAENLFVEVDTDILISEIRISPKRGQEFEDLVSLVIKRHGFDEEIVVKSDLDHDPLF